MIVVHHLLSKRLPAMPRQLRCTGSCCCCSNSSFDISWEVLFQYALPCSNAERSLSDIVLQQLQKLCQAYMQCHAACHAMSYFAMRATLPCSGGCVGTCRMMLASTMASMAQQHVLMCYLSGRLERIRTSGTRTVAAIMAACYHSRNLNEVGHEGNAHLMVLLACLHEVASPLVFAAGLLR